MPAFNRLLLLESPTIVLVVSGSKLFTVFEASNGSRGREIEVLPKLGKTRFLGNWAIPGVALTQLPARVHEEFVFVNSCDICSAGDAAIHEKFEKDGIISWVGWPTLKSWSRNAIFAGSIC